MTKSVAEAITDIISQLVREAKPDLIQYHPLQWVGPTFDDLMEASKSEDINRYPKTVEDVVSILTARKFYVARWSYGYRPDKDGFAVIAKFIKDSGGFALDVGAGKGLWCGLYQRYCRENCPNAPQWVCTDPLPTGNPFVDVDPIRTADLINCDLRYCKTLILSWPLSDGNYDHIALNNFQGDYFIYVGDRSCTGSKDFHKLLAKEWKKELEVPIQSWYHLTDECILYRRNINCGN